MMYIKDAFNIAKEMKEILDKIKESFNKRENKDETLEKFTKRYLKNK